MISYIGAPKNIIHNLDWGILEVRAGIEPA